MSAPDPSPARRVKPKTRFPWVLFVFLLGTVYLFWVLPRQLPDEPIQVEFAGEDTKTP
ncbi:MAG TPA: hypothetical protein PLX06_10400 [Fimbriimonadaceae bacterium]|nr:hypothetical protein [Fimbriimonadaceae bacterium]